MRARWTFIAVICALVLGTLLSACDSDSSEGTPGPTEEVPGGAPIDFDEPPGTSVTAAGSTVEMGIGTYCWTRMCVDKIGPITKGTLSVARGERVVVAVPPGIGAPRQVSVTAFEAGASSTLDNGDTAWEPRFDRSTELTPSVGNQGIEFTADLAPGRYVVSVGMFFDQGDVQYGVLLELR